MAIQPSSLSHREAVSAAMFAAGAQGVHEDGASFVTHFDAVSDARSCAAAVRLVDGGARIESGEIPSVDWSAAWREQIGAYSAGALTVVPPWLSAGRDPATTIVIEPAMAFGTGAHATTRGVLRLMQGVIHAGDVVADLGSGSAVLSIAAATLGAARVAAIEIDHDAIGNAEENVVRNGAAGRVHVIEGDAAIVLPLVAPVRVVLANILSGVITSLLPVIERSLGDGGSGIFSGMMEDERELMMQVLQRAGWRVLREDLDEGWFTVLVGMTR